MLTAILFFLVASTLSQSAQQSADVKELSGLENVWNNAHLRGDADTLESLWSEDLILQVTNMRPMTKAEALSMLRSSQMKFTWYDTSSLRIQVYGDVAVVTGRLDRIRESPQDNIVTDKFQFTKVYIRRSAKWQVVAWHASTTGR
ncbi:MAG TPA: nuclear transport factor 2 family protein [Blastocatellia bacterium]|nr:nuclear transport factor 2 family protein [Blastocatellia bacterium]